MCTASHNQWSSLYRPACQINKPLSYVQCCPQCVWKPAQLLHGCHQAAAGSSIKLLQPRGVTDCALHGDTCTFSK